MLIREREDCGMFLGFRGEVLGADSMFRSWDAIGWLYIAWLHTQGEYVPFH